MTETTLADARSTADEVIGIFVDDSLKQRELPADFWEDAFVLGFLLCVGLQLTQGRHGSDLTPLGAAEATFDALGDASGMGTAAIKDRVGELQNTAEADYLQAMLSADKLVRFISGATGMQQDPVVVHARERMRQDMEAGLFGADMSEERALQVTLLTTLFTDVVVDRFDLAAPAASH